MKSGMTNGNLLTLLSTRAGCAAKLGPKELSDLLSELVLLEENALSGIRFNEDAGLLALRDNVQIVQSIDAITPVCDTPNTFGAIAIAHALGDIYAKGAKPISGLILLGLPLRQVPLSLGKEIMLGASNKLKQAGAALLGGHTLASKELFLGASVTGLVNSSFIPNHKCKHGDLLVLTKPLGSGIIITAQKLVNSGVELLGFAQRQMSLCEQVMTELNKDAANCMTGVGVNACTDVTGFGLIGHLVQMLLIDRLAAHLWFKDIPLMEGVIPLASQDIVSAGCDRNYAHWRDACAFAEDISFAEKMVLFDPQTSGGLLISVPDSKAPLLLRQLSDIGVMAAVIGQVRQAANMIIHVS